MWIRKIAYNKPNFSPQAGCAFDSSLYQDTDLADSPTTIIAPADLETTARASAIAPHPVLPTKVGPTHVSSPTNAHSESNLSNIICNVDLSNATHNSESEVRVAHGGSTPALYPFETLSA